MAARRVHSGRRLSFSSCHDSCWAKSAAAEFPAVLDNLHDNAMAFAGRGHCVDHFMAMCVDALADGTCAVQAHAGRDIVRHDSEHGDCLGPAHDVCRRFVVQSATDLLDLVKERQKMLDGLPVFEFEALAFERQVERVKGANIRRNAKTCGQVFRNLSLVLLQE